MKSLKGGFWGAMVVTILLSVAGLVTYGPAGMAAMLMCFGFFMIPLGFLIGSLVGFISSLFPERVAEPVRYDVYWDEDDQK